MSTAERAWEQASTWAGSSLLAGLVVHTSTQAHKHTPTPTHIQWQVTAKQNRSLQLQANLSSLRYSSAVKRAVKRDMASKIRIKIRILCAPASNASTRPHAPARAATHFATCWLQRGIPASVANQKVRRDARPRLQGNCRDETGANDRVVAAKTMSCPRCLPGPGEG
ncbi:predicted protein [Plenodomus lingam JN3]|uniref:Uncharacterized protein n=1 Tax=Leptosphaeria maculans (strain JN3 / isolate v23.1.3 / race Av1-4-5-6-7-8) TaxID=985895 RepID=E5A7U4_LEPMJ|nr:predicted protein [Plenodomus lingam JN3]CBX99689.1 predicted protein [Plenodomus lingam JN3]